MDGPRSELSPEGLSVTVTFERMTFKIQNSQSAFSTTVGLVVTSDLDVCLFDIKS